MVATEDAVAAARRPREPIPTDLAAIATLVPRVTAATIGVIAAVAFLRGPKGSETSDKAIFVIAVACAALLCVHFLARPPSRAASIVLSVVAAGGLLFGVARTEHPELAYFVWEGFGVSVAIAALLISVWLWRLLDLSDASLTLRTALTVVVAALVAGDLLSLLRTLSNFVDGGNNVYVLNEVLAPAAGRVPDATFVPQYVTLYGWILVPFRHLLSVRDLAQVAMILLSGLAVLSVVLAVGIAYRAMSSPSLWIAAGIVVPLTCVAVAHGATPQSSIAAELQELPIRMFPAMLLSLLGLEELVRLRSARVRLWHLPALGVLAGLIVWNSQDFGAAVTLAYCMLLAAALPRALLWRLLTLWGGGLLAGLALYPLACLVGGTPVRPAYVGLISRAFASGFGSAPIQVPGPVLVVLPLLLSSAAVGWCLLWRHCRGAASVSVAQDRTILTLTLVATWGTAGFVYYLNRSYASGQLQILLMPCGVCLVALASLARDARTRLPSSRGTATSELWRNSFGFWPVALLVSLGFASILQTPNPARSMRDLTKARAAYGFEHQLIPLRIVRAAKSYATRRHGSLGYFGNNANYVHLATGVRVVVLFDDPVQAVLSPEASKEACRFLADHPTDWLLISPTDQSGYGPIDLCGLYRPTTAPHIPAGLLFARVR